MLLFCVFLLFPVLCWRLLFIPWTNSKLVHFSFFVRFSSFFLD